MSRKQIALTLCLCVAALGPSSTRTVSRSVGQNSDAMSKALGEIIHAAPNNFETLRSGEFKYRGGLGLKAKGKIGIPGLARDCLIEKDPFSYVCISDYQTSSQMIKVYQQVKETLSQVVPNWKFKEELLGKYSKATEFLGGPRGPTESSPITLHLYCEFDPLVKEQKPGDCYIYFSVTAGSFSIADLPSRSSSTAQRQTKGNIPPCDDQPGFANITLTVVTSVKPAAGMEWKFDEAPSLVAARILQGLNQNTRNITFKEASGVTPNFYLTVTLSETNEGTRRNTAYVEVTGMGKAGILFEESSGEAPFTGPVAAIDKLSANMLKYFQNGWRTTSRCLQPDGSVRSQ